MSHSMIFFVVSEFMENESRLSQIVLRLPCVATLLYTLTPPPPPTPLVLSGSYHPIGAHECLDQQPIYAIWGVGPRLLATPHVLLASEGLINNIPSTALTRNRIRRNLIIIVT